MMTFSRTLFIVLVSVVALVGGITIEPAAAHGYEANGCTGVPDAGHGFAFHGICDRHDYCYGDKPYGSDAAGRKQCDQVFGAAMTAYCERHGRWSTEELSCRTVARVYYVGVRVLGAAAWDAGDDPTIG